MDPTRSCDSRGARLELLGLGSRKRWHHLLLEVEEVVGLVDEEELECGAAQVVAAQVDLTQVGQGALEVVADPCRGSTEPRGGQRAPRMGERQGMKGRDWGWNQGEHPKRSVSLEVGFGVG